MIRGLVIILACAAAAGGAALAGQEVFPSPRPGSGVIAVTGTVDVGTMPEVTARQGGEWAVGVVSMPEVRIAHSTIAVAGRPYLITWADGTSETVTVTTVGEGGWLGVAHPDGADRQRWVNLAAARSLEDAP